MMHSENQKRNPKFRFPFSAVLLYLVLIAVALSGVTFSKYMTGTTVGDTARKQSKNRNSGFLFPPFCFILC